MKLLQGQWVGTLKINKEKKIKNPIEILTFLVLTPDGSKW